jgi:hypothetical protein
MGLYLMIMLGLIIFSLLGGLLLVAEGVTNSTATAISFITGLLYIIVVLILI